MKIGVDVSFLARDSRGMGRMAKALLGILLSKYRDEYYFLMPLHEKDKRAVMRMYPSSGVEFLPLADADKLDVMLFPWNRVDFTPKCRRVAIIHDVAMFRFFSPNKMDNCRDRDRVRAAAAAADAIATPSEFSKSEISVFLGVPPEKIVVIPLGTDACFTPVSSEGAAEFLKTYSAGCPYLLFVGSPDRRKNLSTLLMAFDCFKDRFDFPHKLVIAGSRPSFMRKPPLLESLLGRIVKKRPDGLEFVWRSMRHKDDVIWLGTVSDSDLTKLYGLSSLFVFPSLYEGFGIPLLEAFACASPVVAADIPVFREIGVDAPLYFDPHDPGELADRIGAVLSSGRLAASMRAKGLERLRHYGWEKTAAGYAGLFRSLL